MFTIFPICYGWDMHRRIRSHFVYRTAPLLEPLQAFRKKCREPLGLTQAQIFNPKARWNKEVKAFWAEAGPIGEEIVQSLLYDHSPSLEHWGGLLSEATEEAITLTLRKFIPQQDSADEDVQRYFHRCLVNCFNHRIISITGKVPRPGTHPHERSKHVLYQKMDRTFAVTEDMLQSGDTPDIAAGRHESYFALRHNWKSALKVMPGKHLVELKDLTTAMESASRDRERWKRGNGNKSNESENWQEPDFTDATLGKYVNLSADRFRKLRKSLHDYLQDKWPALAETLDDLTTHHYPVGALLTVNMIKAELHNRSKPHSVSA